MNRPGKWQWDDVRFFLAAAREGSLSGAARVLGVGHVTVGRRLAFLEKRLGVKLLNRTPDGYAVTSAGQAILRQSAAMEAAALDLERAAAGRDLLAAGSVRITTTEALAYRIIVPATVSLRKSHRDLHVVVLAGVRSLDIARRAEGGAQWGAAEPARLERDIRGFVEAAQTASSNLALLAPTRVVAACWPKRWACVAI